MPDPGGPPLASRSLFSFQDGSAGSGAILLHGLCAFLSCCSGVVLPSARTLFLPQNRLFLGATLARLALILLRVWLYSRPACSSRRLDVCEQEVSLREEKRTCHVSTGARNRRRGCALSSHFCGRGGIPVAVSVVLAHLSSSRGCAGRFRFTEPPWP